MTSRTATTTGGWSGRSRPAQRHPAGYKVDHNGSPAAVALALHHGDDCGVSFVATVPKARRRGLASAVMRQALTAARQNGCTTTTLQATDVGEKLYANLGYRHLCVMQLWERRP